VALFSSFISANLLAALTFLESLRKSFSIESLSSSPTRSDSETLLTTKARLKTAKLNLSESTMSIFLWANISLPVIIFLPSQKSFLVSAIGADNSYRFAVDYYDVVSEVMLEGNLMPAVKDKLSFEDLF